jgi:STE24 endopeptidase
LEKTQPTENYRYDEEKRKVAKRYENIKLILDTVNSTLIPAAFCLTFFLSGASGQLARSLGSASGHYWFSLWAYLAGFVIILQLLAMPIGFYSGFVVDHRFHLSTQTIRGWAMDEAKGLGVELVFGILAGTVLYYLIGVTSLWWVAASAVFAVFSILLSIILPFVILPIFYKVKPLSDVKLKEDLLRMASKAGVSSIDRVLVADESRRSIRANAFFSGVGKSKSIVLFDTLLGNFTHREIITVVAHELGHYVNKDIWFEALTSGLLIIPPFFIANLALRSAVSISILTSLTDPAGIPLIFAVLIIANFALQPISSAISRLVERRADEFALKAANDPEAQASTERRLADLALAVDKPNRLVEALFYTHPPSSKRIQLAEDWIERAQTQDAAMKQ